MRLAKVRFESDQGFAVGGVPNRGCMPSGGKELQVNTAVARVDVRGLSNELAVSSATKLDRPSTKEDPSDGAMVPSNPILFPSSRSIPPRQIFANADPRARILTRAFVSTPAVIAVTLAPSRRAAGLWRTDAPKLPQACCGSLWGATLHGVCRSPPTTRRRIGAPQAPALGIRTRGFASRAV